MQSPLVSAASSNRKKVAKEDSQIMSFTSDQKDDWSETDEQALLLFVADAIKESKSEDLLLNDKDEEYWVKIAARFPHKTAINCLQRYSKTLLRRERGSSIEVASSSRESSAQKRPAENMLEPKPKKPTKAHPITEIVSAVQNTTASKSSTWTDAEVLKLRAVLAATKSSVPSWPEIASNIPGKTVEDCIAKWGELSFDFVKGRGSWTPEEDKILIEQRKVLGR